MTRRERLLARQLPTAVVPLRTAGGGSEPLELRALPADEFEVLMGEHPPTAEQRAAGEPWNEATFMPALLARLEVPVDGEEPLTWQEWADLLSPKSMPFGERTHLIDTALALNDRAPAAELGKDS